MEYSIRGNVLIIQINGDLDHYNAAKIKETSERYIMENRIKHIVFDFKNTDFMDSSGIGTIMGRYRLVKAINGTVSVVNVNEIVGRIFEMSGLYKIVRKCSNLEDAIAADWME